MPHQPASKLKVGSEAKKLDLDGENKMGVGQQQFGMLSGYWCQIKTGACKWRWCLLRYWRIPPKGRSLTPVVASVALRCAERGDT